MGAQEKSLRVYDTRRTFFTKIGSTFSKLFTPTKAGFNGFLIGIKRINMIKAFKAIDKAGSDDKKELCEKKFEEAYSLYLEAIDQLIVDTIYKKVKIGEASDFEKDALSKYYNVIHLKENNEQEYKYRKQQYLIELDYNSLKASKKDKTLKEYQPIYVKEMDRLYKTLLKNYSMTLSERLTPMQKDAAYNKIFDTLEEYVVKIIPLKDVKDEELIKECSLYETYEVGKLDQVDVLDKKMILLGISRKLFVHSLPLIVAEKCYIRLLKETRDLIVDTKIARKRENAYQLLLRLFEQYNKKLLGVKIYWNDNETKKAFNQFNEKLKGLDEVKKASGNHEYEVKKQILFIREDMKYLEKYGDKYFRILNFYRGRLFNLGDMKKLSDSCKTAEYKVVKGLGKVMEHEAAC